MIIVKNLTKHFGTKEIIRDFSYNFPSGNKIAIVGANGVGKTTIINTLKLFIILLNIIVYNTFVDYYYRINKLWK